MLLGDIYAQAAGSIDCKQILLTKSYGPEARGGACRSEIIITDTPVFEPRIKSPDFMLALCQKAYEAYCCDLHSGSIFLVDSSKVSCNGCKTGCLAIGLPLSRIAINVTGKILLTNIVSLGAISALFPLVEVSSLLSVIEQFIAMGKLPHNSFSAFDAGHIAAINYLSNNK